MKKELITEIFDNNNLAEAYDIYLNKTKSGGEEKLKELKIIDEIINTSDSNIEERFSLLNRVKNDMIETNNRTNGAKRAILTKDKNKVEEKLKIVYPELSEYFIMKATPISKNSLRNTDKKKYVYEKFKALKDNNKTNLIIYCKECGVDFSKPVILHCIYGISENDKTTERRYDHINFLEYTSDAIVSLVKESIDLKDDNLFIGGIQEIIDRGNVKPHEQFIGICFRQYEPRKATKKELIEMKKNKKEGR